MFELSQFERSPVIRRCAISGTLRPCADISTTIAGRSFTGSLAVRPIRAARLPSAIVTGRTRHYLVTPHHPG